MPFCTNCGSEIEDHQKFCPACGARNEQEFTSTETQTEPQPPTSSESDTPSPRKGIIGDVDREDIEIIANNIFKNVVQTAIFKNISPAHPILYSLNFYQSHVYLRF